MFLKGMFYNHQYQQNHHDYNVDPHCHHDYNHTLPILGFFRSQTRFVKIPTLVIIITIINIIIIITIIVTITIIKDGRGCLP